VSRLVAALELPRACVVYASGGGLYLLAPNTDTAKETISFVQQEVNRWLYRQFGTGLYFSLVAEPITAAGLARGLGETWYRVGQKLSVEKERKWYREIKEDYATFFAPRPAENPCPICHQAGKELVPYPCEEEFLVCPFCAQMVRLGQILPEVQVFYRLPAGEEVAPRASDLVLEVLGISYLFTREDYSGPAAGYYLVENPWALLRPAAVPAWNFPTGSYFTCKELDDLVKKGLGAERIGVLRLDVDRLGTIFSRGLPREKISFARLNDLSERFNLYFKYYLPALLAREPQEPLLPVHRNRKLWLNLVYAGGDDLFLLGTWNDALEAALRARGWATLLPLERIHQQSAQAFARWSQALAQALGQPLSVTWRPRLPRTVALTLVARQDFPGGAGEPAAILRFALPVRGLPRFAAGDLLGIVPPGEAVSRYYSLASGRADGFVEICVRRMPGGVCSNLLHALQPGESVQAFIRSNPGFVLPAGRTPVLLIGAGTGVAPLAGFIRGNARHRPMHLYVGARDPARDFYFGAELQAWQAEGRLAGLHTTFSRTPGGGYVQDLLQRDAAQVRDLLAQGAIVRVCGSRPMAEGVAQVLDALLAPLGQSLAQLKAKGRYAEDLF